MFSRKLSACQLRRRGHGNDGQRPYPLCAVDQYAFNIGGSRRPGYEYPVPNVELRALAIRVVEVPKQRLFIALCIQTALASHPTTRVA